MPLVKTPMIAPSRRLNPVPPITAEHAAAMVVRGLIEKPARIDTPMGTLADVGMYFTPKLSRRVLHQLYLGYPDSAAARGVERDRLARTPSRRPTRPVRAVAKVRVPRPRQARGSVGARRALVADQPQYGYLRAAARLRRRRHGRRRRDGAGVPVRQLRRRTGRHRLHRGKRSGATGLPEQPRPAGAVPGSRAFRCPRVPNSR